MASYSNTVTDDSGYRRPVPGVQVYVLNPDGSTAASADPQPALTDAFGAFTVSADAGVYQLDYRVAGVSYFKETVTIGDPPQYIGPTGPSNNTRVNLAALKAAAITDLTSLYDGSLWTWETANAPYTADDINVVKANSTALSVGAWVRQSPRRTDLAASTGSTLIGHHLSATGAVTRTVADKLGETVSVRDFGVGDPTAFQKAIDYLSSTQFGGVLEIPTGLYLSDPMTITAQAGKTILFKGDGKRASVIKPTSTAGPLVTFDGTGVVDVYGGFEDVGFYSDARNLTGLKFNRAARFMFNRVSVVGFDIGLDLLDTLVFLATDCSINSSNTNYRFRGIELGSNLVRITGGECRDGKVYGVDLDNASGCLFDGVDFEQNGTTGDANTGGVLIRGNLGMSVGIGDVAFRSCWFEENRGHGALKVLAGNTNLRVEDCQFFSSENGADITVGAILNSLILAPLAPASATGTVSIAAGSSTVIGGQIQVLTDTSTNRVHINVDTNAGPVNRFITNGAVRWDGSKVGFYDKAPINRLTAPAALAPSADLAAHRDFLNALRQNFLDLGLLQ